MILLLIFIFLTTLLTETTTQNNTNYNICKNGEKPEVANASSLCYNPHSNNPTCCHGYYNPLETTTLEQEVNKILSDKFAEMRKGFEFKNDVTCDRNNSLLTSTKKAMETLRETPWEELLKLTSPHCRMKLAKAFLCSSDSCVPNNPLLPCHTYCLNILHSCLSQVTRSIWLPWKHAVNSISSAIKLLKLSCHGNIDNINSYREPFHWLDKACELKASNSDTSCQGDGKDYYDEKLSSWEVDESKRMNPESIVSSWMDVELDRELTRVKDELIKVVKDLEQFYPKAVTTTTTENEDPPQSDESFEYDDYSGSGELLETDDEDLIGERGSGGYHDSNNDQDEDQETNSNNNNPISNDIVIIDENKKSACITNSNNIYLLSVLLLLTLNL